MLFSRFPNYQTLKIMLPHIPNFPPHLPHRPLHHFYLYHSLPHYPNHPTPLPIIFHSSRVRAPHSIVPPGAPWSKAEGVSWERPRTFPLRRQVFPQTAWSLTLSSPKLLSRERARWVTTHPPTFTTPQPHHHHKFFHSIPGLTLTDHRMTPGPTYHVHLPRHIQ